MNLKDKKILVTGATGFIGSHLVDKLLLEGADITIIKRPASSTRNIAHILNRLKVIPYDLNEYEEIKKALQQLQPQIVFHLAAHVDVSRDIPITNFIETDLKNTIALINALDGNYEIFVNSGTCEEYGKNSVPFKEDQAPNPVSPYSATKVAITHYLEMLHKTKGLPITTLRPFLTYGPRQIPKMLIPDLIIKGLTNQSFRMTKGEQTREFNYIDDIIDGYILAAKKQSTIGEIVNIGNGEEITISEVVDKVLDLMNNPIIPDKSLSYREGETMHFYCDNKKAKDLLGWKRKTSLEEGLRKTINWYKEAFNSGALKQWMVTS